MNDFIQISLIVLLIGSIFSNVVHQYDVFDSFSSIESKFLRILQNLVFCGLVSYGILIFALLGELWVSAAGAVIEMIVNFEYYNRKFTERDIMKRIKKHWAAYFFAVIIPSLIFLFSHKLAEIINQ